MDTISRESNGNSLLPIAGAILGAIGLLLGGIALAKISTANKIIAAHEEKLARLDSIDADVKAASDKADKANTAITSLGRQTQDAFNSVGTELGNLRTDLTKLAEARKAAPKGEKGAPVATGVVGEDGNYVVAAGDSLGKIAKKFAVTLSDLQAANPGVESKHLRVGQKVKIPKK